MSEQNTRILGGVPTNVVYEDGTASFDGNNSRIEYPDPVPAYSPFSIRLKFKTNALGVIQYLFHSFGATGGIYIQIAASGFVSIRFHGFCDDSPGVIVANKWYELVISYNGAKYTIYMDAINKNSRAVVYNPDSSTLFIGARNDNFSELNGYMDIVEIYNEAFTAEEVKNLYNGQRYRDIPPQTSTYKEILNIDSRRGAIYDTYNNIFTNTKVVPERDGEIYAENYNGADSRLVFSTDIIGINSITFLCWIKPRSFGETNRGRIVDNGKFWIETLGPASNILVTSNGASNSQSTNSSVILGKWMLVGINRASTGITNIYINGKINGTPNKSTGTPVAGINSLAIGSTSAATRTSDALFGKKIIIKGLLSAEEHSQFYTSTKQYYGK